MRLTLRTLLAYRDGVLASDDREDLHRRVQQSQDASNLLARINQLVNSGAIEESGLSIAVASEAVASNRELASCNTVAEYLDDALLGPHVSEFEKQCLESDLRLTELAQCHEVLAQAMHTEVVTRPPLLERLHSLSDPQKRDIEFQRLRSETRAEVSGMHLRVDSPHPTGASVKAPSPPGADVVSTNPRNPAGQGGSAPTDESSSVDIQAPMIASGGETIRPAGLSLESSEITDEAPELRGSVAGNRWQIPVAVGMLFVLVGLLVWQLLGSMGEKPGPLLGDSSPNSTDEIEKAPSVEQGLEPENGKPLVPATADSEQKSSADSFPATSRPEDSKDAAAEQGTSDPESAADSPQTESAPETPAAAVGDVSAPTTELADQGKQADEVTEITNVQELAWQPATRDEFTAIVLVQDADSLNKALDGAAIAPGERILIPPTCKTSFQLPPSLRLNTFGAFVGSVPRWDEASCEIDITLGKMLLETSVGEQTTKVNSAVGIATIQTTAANSKFSVEVKTRKLRHGSIVDPNIVAPTFVVTALQGAVALTLDLADGSTASFEIEQQQGVVATTGLTTRQFKATTLPGWTTNSGMRAIDRLAAEDLSTLLSKETASEIGLDNMLPTLAGYRRPETAALAIQCQLLAGDWSSLYRDCLSKSNMRAHWETILTLARELLAADNSQLAALEKSLTSEMDINQAKQVMNLIVGQPRSGDLATDLRPLVELLDSDELAIRVLGSNQLFMLTGERFGYLPHSPSRASVQQWRREQASGRLKLISPL